MKIVKVIAIALLLIAPLAHAEAFDPKTLNDAAIERFFSYNKYLCFVVTKGGKRYLVIRYDDSNGSRFVYEAIGPKEKPIFELLWAKEMV